ncbi:NAD(P)-dependent oxidoreductase [Candidatus Peregrinibacteria bacterium]|nr:NAD(P)-dependent oxidoreductase [Candidatus Peregrinibacteria bacterium]
MKWKGRNVLVTGGTGFIGSFLVERLLDLGAKVRVPMRAKYYRALSERRSEIEWMEGDLRDSDYCRRLTDGMDEIFHLAACRRNVAFHEERASHVLQENVRMTLALLEGLRDQPAVPVTFFSTANVPPEVGTLHLSHKDTIDGYTLGKAMAEILWHVAARERGFPVLLLRPVGVYGPRDTFTEEGNVIPALFTKCMKAGRLQAALAQPKNSPQSRSTVSTAVRLRTLPRSAASPAFDIWGTGREERAFLYVEDLIDGLFTLIDARATGVQYISSGEVVTIRELATMIRDFVSPKLPLRFHPEIHLGPRTIPLLAPHKSLKRMAWTPFEEGLKKTYESWK